ncbi:MAG: hypothetical protein IKC22_05285 [Bacilli bacterium]|nr:hypothetical protein [Bacilli bacterium]
MGFSDFFSNDFETSNNHSNNRLKTRHYRGEYNKVKAAVIVACGVLNLEVQEVNEEYHEIRCDNRKQEMIIDIFSNSYFDQAVDVKVNTRYLLPCGRGIKLIEEFYSLLDKALVKLD